MILIIAATLTMYDGQRWNVHRDMSEPQCIELATTFLEAAKVNQTSPVRVNWACQRDSDGAWLTPKLLSEVLP